MNEKELEELIEWKKRQIQDLIDYKHLCSSPEDFEKHLDMMLADLKKLMNQRKK